MVNHSPPLRGRDRTTTPRAWPTGAMAAGRRGRPALRGGGGGRRRGAASRATPTGAATSCRSSSAAGGRPRSGTIAAGVPAAEGGALEPGRGAGAALGDADDLAAADRHLAGAEAGEAHRGRPRGAHERRPVDVGRHAELGERGRPHVAEPVEGPADVVVPQRRRRRARSRRPTAPRPGRPAPLPRRCAGARPRSPRRTAARSTPVIVLRAARARGPAPVGRAHPHRSLRRWSGTARARGRSAAGSRRAPLDPPAHADRVAGWR